MLRLAAACAWLAAVCALEARTRVTLVRSTPAPPATPTPVPRPVPWREPAALPASPRSLLPLAARCIEATFARYTYAVCPFHNVSQRDTAAHYLLGVFEGVDRAAAAGGGGGGSSSIGSLRFTDGCSCGGKRRRATVSLVCGRADALLDVTEAPTCDYALTLASPEACAHQDEVDEAAAAAATVAVVARSPAPEEEGEEPPPSAAAICAAAAGGGTGDAAARTLCATIAELRQAVVNLASMVADDSATAAAPPCECECASCAASGDDTLAPPPPPDAAAVSSNDEDWAAEELRRELEAADGAVEQGWAPPQFDNALCVPDGQPQVHTVLHSEGMGFGAGMHCETTPTGGFHCFLLEAQGGDEQQLLGDADEHEQQAQLEQELQEHEQLEHEERDISQDAPPPPPPPEQEEHQGACMPHADAEGAASGCSAE